MLYKFYGLTSMNVILTGVSPKLFVRCLESFKKDPLILTLVKRQFEEINKVISSIPSEYEEPKDRMMYAKLRRLEKDNPNDEQIEVLKDYLKDKPSSIAPFVMINGEKVIISEISKNIILYLKNNRETIKRYSDFIEVNYSLEDEVLFFEQPLYRLRNYNEKYFMFLLEKLLKRYSDNNNISDDFWDYISRFIDYVIGYVNDDVEENYNLSEILVSDVSTFISNLDYSYFNTVLNLDYELEDYYKASMELYNIGLIGFNPFIEEMFKEFTKSHQPNYVSDLHISKSSDLYKFVIDLKRALDSNLNIGDSLVISDDEEVDIDL